MQGAGHYQRGGDCYGPGPQMAEQQMAQFQHYQEQYRLEQEQLNEDDGHDGNMEVKEFISEEDDDGDQGEEGYYEGEEESDEELEESRQGYHAPGEAGNETEQDEHGVNPGLDTAELEDQLQNYDGLQEMAQDKNGAF